MGKCLSVGKVFQFSDKNGSEDKVNGSDQDEDQTSQVEIFINHTDFLANEKSSLNGK